MWRKNALKVLLNVEDAISINPSSPLFMNHDLPDELYFKNLVSTGSYIVSKLRIQEAMADNQLKISKSAYIPTIALFGKQTLYAENLPKNLMPRTLVGVGFTWNIFDGLNREANIRQTRLTKQTLQLGREKIPLLRIKSPPFWKPFSIAIPTPSIVAPELFTISISPSNAHPFAKKSSMIST